MSDYQVRFGSVCSGLEAASVAWSVLGWKATWFAEIELYPSKVLAHHYPDVPNLGNMLLIPALLRNGTIEAPDVLCGGTPCQSFSIAGLRNSLGDKRGNLSLTFCEIANEIDIQRAAAGLLPCVVKWENVPGVLTTEDNAFGCFLAGLAGATCTLVPEPCPAAGKSGKFWKWKKSTGSHTLSWPKSGCVIGPQRTVAWRVLDAQYFGLAQRRNRVFVVASAREGFDPVAVLLEFDGVRRDSAPSRSQGQEIAGSVTASLGKRGGQPDCGSTPGYLQPVEVTGTLQVAQAFGGNNSSGPIDVATARNACSSASGRLDFESETFIVQAPPIAFNSRETPVSSTEVFGALGCSSPQAQAVAEPIAFSCKDYGADATVGLSPTLRAMNHSDSHANGGGQMAIAGAMCAHAYSGGMGGRVDLATQGYFQVAPAPIGLTGEINASADMIGALDAGSRSGGGQPSMVYTGGMAVRRLMPIECERLQGFPDGYTLIPIGKKMAADGPRYKAIGNSWAIPCITWIGRRIDNQLRGKV